MIENGFRAFPRGKMSHQDTQLNTFRVFFFKLIKFKCLSGHSKRRPNIGFQDRLSLNAGHEYCRMLQGEHSAILPTCIKPPFVIEMFFVYFECPLKTGFTVAKTPILAASRCSHMRICVYVGTPL